MKRRCWERWRVLFHGDVERLAASLRALELLDFYRQASAWAEVADRHDIPLAHRPLVLQFAIAGVELSDIFPDQLRHAIDEIAALPEQSETQDALLSTAGLGSIVAALGATTSPDACQRLLRALRGTSVDWEPLLASLGTGHHTRRHPKKVAPWRHWGTASRRRAMCRSAWPRHSWMPSAGVRLCSIGCAIAIHGSRELEIGSVDGELVGVAKFLYVSEAEQADARERAVEIGRRLLRALPDIEKVDVKPVLAGGRVLEVDGHEYASSGLRRRYDHHPGALGWNRDRIALAQTLFGASETERLNEASDLLAEAALLVRNFGNMFVRSRGPSAQVTELLERCNALNAKGRDLPPRLEASPFSEGDEAELVDPLSSVITDVCSSVLPRLANPAGYVALSAYINETLLDKRVPAVREQPWRLLGLDGAPRALDDLAGALAEIDAVLTELSADSDSNRAIVNTARSGTPEGALARAADRSLRRTRRRLRERRKAVAADLKSTGLGAEVVWSDGDRARGESPNFAVTVAVESLTDWPVALEELVPRLEDYPGYRFRVNRPGWCLSSAGRPSGRARSG